MATKTSQRVGIWIIAIVMSVGTLGAFFLPMIVNSNETKDAEESQKILEQLNQQQAAAAEPLNGYSAEAFDASSVTALKVETLKEPTGETAATPESTVTANYFGWTSDGKIFDSSQKDGTATPVPFGLNQVITGWTEGLTGAKAGGVYKLTIPADKAYGNDASSGRPTGPLVFIVQVDKVE